MTSKITIKNIGFSRATVWMVLSFVLGITIYLLSLSWLNLVTDANFWFWRREVILLTGIVAWVWMTLCMVIAIRPKCLDKWMDGLDKAYALHKWAGIGAVIVSVLHWLSDKVARWFVELGWLAAPAGRPKGEAPLWMTVAKDSSEIGLYILIAFIAIALISKIPYKFFQKSHQVLAVVYLVLVYHAVAMVPFEWWTTPAPYLIVLVSLVGAWCAVLALTKTFNKSSRYQGTVKNIEQNSTGMVSMDVTLESDRPMPHQPGQFAFINFGHEHGAYPFTIASANPQVLSFAIKPLGDFTQKIMQLIKPEQAVRIEGPYGQFTFNAPQPHQVWVAGGVGITPFMSRLQYLAENGGSNKIVDFWYCIRTQQEGFFPNNLDELCAKAHVRLHRIVTENDPKLTAQTVHDTVQNTVSSLSDVSVWFCGPAGFAQTLQTGLTEMGLAKESFHTEMFNFR